MVHLATRLFGSLSRRPPDPNDAAWATAHLSPGEQGLWARMPTFDQRHAVGVARRAVELLPGASDAVIAAALLHDVGKIDSGLGVTGRVVATVWKAIRGARSVAAGTGRMARYVDHPAIGGELLAAAGADPLTQAWAREHHLPERAWSVPLEVGRALKAADDD